MLPRNLTKSRCLIGSFPWLPDRNGLLQPTRLVLEDVKLGYTMIWTELDLAPAQA